MIKKRENKMKSILLVLFLVLAVITSIGAGPIKSYELISAQAIAGSGTFTSKAIDLASMQAEGYFALTVTTAGVGSGVKVEYLVCDTEYGTYLEPDGATDIVAAQVPGTIVYGGLSLKGPANFIKFKVTEVNAANVTSCTVIATVQ
jgi:hypothetical protein